MSREICEDLLTRALDRIAGFYVAGAVEALQERNDGLWQMIQRAESDVDAAVLAGDESKTRAAIVKWGKAWRAASEWHAGQMAP